MVFLNGFNLVLSAQSWSQSELNAANTAAKISGLSHEEKETIKYVNLARMYPQKFAMLEVKDYFGGEGYGNYLQNSPYRQSLMKDLGAMSPVEPVYFLQEMQNLASCFARESGSRGVIGHTRINCSKGYNGECCSYGHATAREIVLQLLIDHDVPSLGHRKICLNPRYLSIGVSIAPHTKYDNCAVLDFKIGKSDGED